MTVRSVAADAAVDVRARSPRAGRRWPAVPRLLWLAAVAAIVMFAAGYLLTRSFTTHTASSHVVQATPAVSVTVTPVSVGGLAPVHAAPALKVAKRRVAPTPPKPSAPAAPPATPVAPTTGNTVPATAAVTPPAPTVTSGGGSPPSTPQSTGATQTPASGSTSPSGSGSHSGGSGSHSDGSGSGSGTVSGGG